MVIAALNIGDPVFIGGFFGFLISLPIALFLTFWLSNVKNRIAVVAGAFVGALLGFLIIQAWAGTLIFNSSLAGANGGSAFFGCTLFCSAMGLIAGILADLLVARRNTRDYRRRIAE
jgi:biotin transporter BioY